MGVILRDSKREEITVSNVQAECTAVDLRDTSGGILIIKTDPGDITVHVSDKPDGTYYKLSNSLGVALGVMDTGADDEAIALPDELFAAHWVKFVAADSKQDAIILLKG